MPENSHILEPQAYARALLAELEALLAELRPGRAAVPVDLDSALDKDLGLDSLARVELMHRIERRFDVVPDERLFAEAETPRDLLRAIGRSGPAQEKGLAAVHLPESPQVREPLAAKTLVEVLQWHGRRHPERLHVHFYHDGAEVERLSYGQLLAGALRLARGLQASGVLPGQPVAIMLPTGPDYFYSFMGVLLAGGVPVPVYPPSRMALLEEHLRRYVGVLDNCQARLLITVTEGKSHARWLCPLVASLRQVVAVEELAVMEGEWVEPALKSGDTAFLQYTSGSTGNPKGVVLTHANLLANIRAMGRAVGAGSDDVFVSWLPLYHDMGLIGAWLGSLYFAMSFVVMPPLSFISRPQRWLEAIHRYRGTLSASPNFGYETCLRRLSSDDIAKLDLSCWRAAFNGAEAVLPETVERFTARFQACGFRPEAMMPVYGLAESSVGLAFPPLGRGPKIDRIRRDTFSREGLAVPAAADDALALNFVACGLPLAGHQLRVVDEAGRELPERRQGRIEFRGPSATCGYFRNREHTRALFDGEWLVSGDLGYLVEGEVYVTGRGKDIVIRAGRNIYPQEVEQAVGGIDGIRKECVAVFGGGDAVTGTERLIVLAETRRLSGEQGEALRTRVNSVVTALIGEPPDEVVLAPPGAVLKTSSGKIRRSAIRAAYERGETGVPQSSPWQAYLWLGLETLAGRTRRRWQRAMDWLFAAHAWCCFGALALPVWMVALTVFDPARRWHCIRVCLAALRWATRTPVTVQGLENLPGAGNPCVLVANHSSYLDAYLLILSLPDSPLEFVAKVELSRNPCLGAALRRLGTKFVERFDREKSVADVQKLVGDLRSGERLVFFPEGTFSRRPGLLPLHLGAFAVAVAAEVPVVPVALRGTRSMLRGGSWFPRRGALSVVVGPPLESAKIREECGGDEWLSTLKLRDRVRRHLLQHTGEPDLGEES